MQGEHLLHQGDQRIVAGGILWVAESIIDLKAPPVLSKTYRFPSFSQRDNFEPKAFRNLIVPNNFVGRNKKVHAVS